MGPIIIFFQFCQSRLFSLILLNTSLFVTMSDNTEASFGNITFRMFLVFSFSITVQISHLYDVTFYTGIFKYIFPMSSPVMRVVFCFEKLFSLVQFYVLVISNSLLPSSVIIFANSFARVQ